MNGDVWTNGRMANARVACDVASLSQGPRIHQNTHSHTLTHTHAYEHISEQLPPNDPMHKGQSHWRRECTKCTNGDCCCCCQCLLLQLHSFVCVVNTAVADTAIVVTVDVAVVFVSFRFVLFAWFVVSFFSVSIWCDAACCRLVLLPVAIHLKKKWWTKQMKWTSISIERIVCVCERERWQPKLYSTKKGTIP